MRVFFAPNYFSSSLILFFLPIWFELIILSIQIISSSFLSDGGVENSRTMLAADQEELDEIEQFEHQSNLGKWGVRLAAFCLVFALLFLWIWYR